MGNGIRDYTELHFDEYQRNAYVQRFSEAFLYDRDRLGNEIDIEAEICQRVYAIHLEICNNQDLYIAVVDRLEAHQRRALHLYSQCRGVLQNRQSIPLPDSFCGELLPDGDTCILIRGHSGAHAPLPF